MEVCTMHVAEQCFWLLHQPQTSQPSPGLNSKKSLGDESLKINFITANLINNIQLTEVVCHQWHLLVDLCGLYIGSFAGVCQELMVCCRRRCSLLSQSLHNCAMCAVCPCCDVSKATAHALAHALTLVCPEHTASVKLKSSKPPAAHLPYSILPTHYPHMPDA